MIHELSYQYNSVDFPLIIVSFESGLANFLSEKLYFLKREQKGLEWSQPTNVV